MRIAIIIIILTIQVGCKNSNETNIKSEKEIRKNLLADVYNAAQPYIAATLCQELVIPETLSDYYTVFIGFTEIARSMVNDNLDN